MVFNAVFPARFTRESRRQPCSGKRRRCDITVTVGLTRTHGTSSISEIAHTRERSSWFVASAPKQYTDVSISTTLILSVLHFERNMVSQEDDKIQATIRVVLEPSALTRPRAHISTAESRSANTTLSQDVRQENTRTRTRAIVTYPT